jgi:hypothetical protein
VVKTGLSLSKEVKHGQVDGFVFTRRDHLGPRLAGYDGVLPVHGVYHALEAAVIREQCGDDAHL